MDSPWATTQHMIILIHAKTKGGSVLHHFNSDRSFFSLDFRNPKRLSSLIPRALTTSWYRSPVILLRADDPQELFSVIKLTRHSFVALDQFHTKPVVVPVGVPFDQGIYRSPIRKSRKQQFGRCFDQSRRLPFFRPQASCPHVSIENSR